ncbi:MAG: glycosyltransferase [Acidaminococcales bacterium]|nr:glycosyltransferase [Acidaminococcales bacterium]
MQELVSIIVPVYKVRQYIHKCVNSVINQSYDNLEIILVDDGSPDDCGRICDEYARQDKRVRAIHQQNRGLSAARNFGLDAARGDYVVFVDSDDHVDADMCRNMLAAAKAENADIVVANFYKETERGLEKCEFPPPSGPDSLIAARRAILMDKTPSYVWNKMYKASLFINVRFVPGLYFEDMAIMPDLFFLAEKIAFVPDAYYHYNCLKRDSITFSSPDLLKLGKMKYGSFVAWRAREEKAGGNFPEECLYIQSRTIKSALGALLLGKKLTAGQRAECRAYLSQKKGARSAEIGAKAKFLWWCLDNFPIVCRIYPKFSQLARLYKRIGR